MKLCITSHIFFKVCLQAVCMCVWICFATKHLPERAQGAVQQAEYYDDTKHREVSILFYCLYFFLQRLNIPTALYPAFLFSEWKFHF